MSEKITLAYIAFGGVVLTQAGGYFIARQAVNDLRANIAREIDIIRKLRPGSTEATTLEAHVTTSIAKLLKCQKADDSFPTITPHDLRHTAASLAVSAGANVKAVQRMLGHAKASMTLDVYASLFDDDLDDVAANLYAAIRATAPTAARRRHG